MVPETLMPGPDGTKNIADLQAGDRVWSWVDGKLEAHGVVAAWRSEDQEVYKVRTRGRTTVASSNHQFLRIVETARKTTHREAAAWAGLPPGRVPYGSRKDAACSLSGCRRRVDARGMCPRHFQRWQRHGDPRVYETTATIFGYEWAHLDRLNVGDLLVTLDLAPIQYGRDASRWDRCHRGCRMAARCDPRRRHDRRTAHPRLRLWRDLRAGTPHHRGDVGANSSAEHPGYGTLLHSAYLARLLASMSMQRPAHEKRVPDAVWQWPRNLQLAFLDGYRDADGHTPKNTKRHGERTYASSSRQLIAEVRMLHMLAGHHVSNISETKRGSPIIIKGVQVKHPRTLYNFAVWPAGRGGLSRIRQHPGLDKLLPAGHAFGLRRVLAIEAAGFRETWDLEVEGTHNLVADGILAHDRASPMPSSAR